MFLCVACDKWPPVADRQRSPVHQQKKNGACNIIILSSYCYQRKPKVVCARPSEFPAEFLEDTPVRSRDSPMKQQANYNSDLDVFQT